MVTLLYEVGWNARHSYIDVREVTDGATVRDALRVPLLPEVHTFEERVTSSVRNYTRRPRDPLDDDPTSARLVVGCSGLEDGEDARTAARLLQQAGFTNLVMLDGGFERWRDGDHPIEGGDEDDMPDSTF